MAHRDHPTYHKHLLYNFLDNHPDYWNEKRLVCDRDQLERLIDNYVEECLEDIRQKRQGDYDKGFKDGKEEGHEQGYEEGIDKGFADGEKLGYKKGLVEGISQGTKEGREDLIKDMKRLLRHKGDVRDSERWPILGFISEVCYKFKVFPKED